jgi:hypothetical protein
MYPQYNNNKNKLQKSIKLDQIFWFITYAQIYTLEFVGYLKCFRQWIRLMDATVKPTKLYTLQNVIDS